MKNIKEILNIFSPIIILIPMLIYNVIKFPEGGSLEVPNQIALIIAAFFAGTIALKNNVSLKNLTKGIITNIKSSMNAMIILLIIGGLTATWILCGIVPAMIYYGIEIINPRFF